MQQNSSSSITPVTGVYHFGMGAEIYTITAIDDASITKGELRLQRTRNGSTTTIPANLYSETIADRFDARLTISQDFFLQAGDILYLEIYHKNANSQAGNLNAEHPTHILPDTC